MSTSIPSEFWSVAPFDAFDEVGREAFVAAAERREVSAGQAVYERGATARGAWALVSGVVELSDPEMRSIGMSTPNTYDAPGMVLSTGSLLQDFAHRRHCTARTDAVLLCLPRDVFEARLLVGDAFAARLLDYTVSLSGREVRALNAAIHSLLSRP